MGARISKESSFVDHFLEGRVDPEGTLSQVDRLIDWKPIEKLLSKRRAKVCDAAGQPAYPGLTMFKILLLQRWHNLSDHGAAAALRDRISFLVFCGLSFHSATPDAATICRFRQSLLHKDLYRSLLEAINAQMEVKELLVKKGVAVDATLVRSCRRPRKVIDVMPVDRKEPEEPAEDRGTDSEAVVSYSDDVEATWVKKGDRPHYGFKAHAVTEVIEGFFLGGEMTPANVADTKELKPVVEDLELSPDTLVIGDKAYDSRENRDYLKENHLADGILQKARRGRPLCQKAIKRNRRLSFLRYVVEQAFGTFKRRYGFERARYLGLAKTELELYLIGMAFNLKKAVGIMASA
jgi:IS5 family transposase